MKIYVAGFVGLCGAARISESRGAELLDYYPHNLLDNIKASFIKETRKETKVSEDIFLPLGEGGFLEGLWRLWLSRNKGFDIILEKVFLTQETIEISEYFNINPFMLDSTGCGIIVCEDDDLINDISRGDLCFRHIGHTLDNEDKIIRYDSKSAYLTRPDDVELNRINGLY